MSAVGEALRELEHEGLVEVEPKVGARVAKRDAMAVRSDFILRIAIECEAARQCAIRHVPAHLSTLEHQAVASVATKSLNRTVSALRILCLIAVLAAGLVPTTHAADPKPREFCVWATSCSHVPADIRKGRESLAKAIRQSEGLDEKAPAFDWDIMIDAGDLSAHQSPPGDHDGMELQRQY